MVGSQAGSHGGRPTELGHHAFEGSQSEQWPPFLPPSPVAWTKAQNGEASEIWGGLRVFLQVCVWERGRKDLEHMLESDDNSTY